MLKGPQGTLYGGSSQGGTIRFITPTPSFTTTSGMLRIEGNHVRSGDNGYDIERLGGRPDRQGQAGLPHQRPAPQDARLHRRLQPL